MATIIGGITSSHIPAVGIATSKGLFEDPYWKAVAFYRSGDFEQAVDWFARTNTAEATFNLGNAYAHLQLNEEAVAAYDEALLSKPDWLEAQENRAVVQALLDAPATADDEDEGAPGKPTFDADEVQFDERGKKGERGEVEMELLSDDQLAEMWMRRLQSTPADFLRFRFASEAAAEQRAEDSQ